MILKAVTLPILALGICASSNAALIAYEGFNYSSGSQTAIGGGTGWSGNWHTSSGVGTNATLNIAAASLTQGSLTTSGGSLNNTGAVAYRGLNATATAAVANESTTNGEVWISFVGNGPSTFGGITLWNAGSTNFADSNANYSVILGHFTGDNGNWNWSDTTTVGNGAFSGISSTTQVLYVMRFDYQATQTTANFYLFTGLNPDSTPLLSEAAYSASGVISDVSGNRPVFDRIRASGNVMNLDEIRIGTTAADVIPVVPEPSVALLGGLGLLGLLRRRR